MDEENDDVEIEIKHNKNEGWIEIRIDVFRLGAIIVFICSCLFLIASILSD